MKSNYQTKPLKEAKGENPETKDDIHGAIEICPLIRCLMDCEMFQRLRGLRQLGATHYIYVNANHTRFEHSLGVAHLARRLCNVLSKKQPQLGISSKDIKCLEIAGLYHDLGHGPFSHVFDGPFQNQIQKLNPHYKKVKHEITSLRMIDAALAELGLKIDSSLLDDPLKQVGDGINAEMFGVVDAKYKETKSLPFEKVLTSRDWIFIKECINGEPLEGETNFCGRPKEKEFLYDIISNRHSGLDVDKIDYFARDAKRALGKGGGLSEKIINEAFVAKGECSQPIKGFQCNDDVHFMICYPEKLVKEAMHFFRTRFNLHSHVYTHKTKQVEQLICDILAEVDQFYERIPNGISLNGCPQFVKISEAMMHPTAFLNLKDSIIDIIEHDLKNNSFEFEKKKHVLELISRLRNRKLYKCACTLNIYNDNPDHEKLWTMSEEDIKKKMLEVEDQYKAADKIISGTKFPKSEDFFVVKRVIHHGMKDKNPVDFMRFLPKNELSKLDRKVHNLPMAVKIDESTYKAHIPRSFQERSLIVFSTNEDNREEVTLLSEQFIDMQSSDAKAKMTEQESFTSPGKNTVTLTQESIDSSVGTRPESSVKRGRGRCEMKEDMPATKKKLF